jgi:hypothetical protein
MRSLPEMTEHRGAEASDQRSRGMAGQHADGCGRRTSRRGRRRPKAAVPARHEADRLLTAVLVIGSRFADARRLADMMRRAQPTWLLPGAVL